MSSQDSQPFHWHFTEFDDQNLEIRGRTLFLLVVLLSIVILVSLLFLYARWVCRYHNHPDHHLPSAGNINNSPQPPPPPPPRQQGLDAAAIISLPIKLYRSSSTAEANNCCVEESECCICLSQFEDGDKVKMLPECRHCYHSDCVDRWLIAQSSCPLCRVSLRVDTAVSQIVTQ